MAFKMKGFMPYGKSPMRQEQQYIPFDFEEDVSTEDISQTNPTNTTNPTNIGVHDIVMLDSDYEDKDPVVTEKRGLRFWKKKQNASKVSDRGSKYHYDDEGNMTHIESNRKEYVKDKDGKRAWTGNYVTGKDGLPLVNKMKTESQARKEGSYANSHSVRSGDTYKGKFAMNQGDQKEIQKQINKQGHFGDIPPSLMKGYGPRNSPSYRARVAEINDHHEYMANSDRFDKGRGKHDLNQQLSRKRPENFSSRFTDFEGNNTYDERGKVRRKYGRG